MKEVILNASSDELKLHLLISEPEEKAIGTILIIHGMCEHKERYIDFMQWLSQRGFVCICYDQRGHGKAAAELKELGYMRTSGWKGLIEDCRVVAEWIAEQYPDIPHNLFGHSMGSLIVRSFTKRYDNLIDTLFVCGCPTENRFAHIGLFIAKAIGFICGQKSLPKSLQAMSFGAFNKNFKRENCPVAWICSDKEVQKAYMADPLCSYRFTANGFQALLGLMKDCYSAKGWAVSKPSLPIAFISGEDDPCKESDQALENAVKLMGKVGYEAVALKMYPNMRHEVLNEIGKEAVWEDVLDLLAYESR